MYFCTPGRSFIGKHNSDQPVRLRYRLAQLKILDFAI